jgi:hypothetical protein
MGKFKLRYKVKKVTPVHTMKVYGKNRHIAPLTLQLGTSWRGVVNFTHRPLYL